MLTLDTLHQQILACRLCADKFGFEPQPVVWGNAQAKIFQISQAPSLSVHKSGKPFDDASGRKLIHDWYGITPEQFYNKNNFYISAIAHCYPGKTPKGGDRKPPLSCARKWLEEEMELVENKLYIIIGSVAAKYFFPGTKFDDLVFLQELKLNDKPAIVLPHPSPANRFWFNRHPEFENVTLKDLTRKIKDLINKT